MYSSVHMTSQKYLYKSVLLWNRTSWILYGPISRGDNNMTVASYSTAKLEGWIHSPAMRTAVVAAANWFTQGETSSPQRTRLRNEDFTASTVFSQMTQFLLFQQTPYEFLHMHLPINFYQFVSQSDQLKTTRLKGSVALLSTGLWNTAQRTACETPAPINAVSPSKWSDFSTCAAP